MQLTSLAIYLQDYILVQALKVSRMSKSSKGLDWADQWDPIQDDAPATKNQDASKSSSKEKMAKAKAAASVGMRKTKAAAIVGMQKTKVVATIGAQKLKAGTTAGMKWIKEKTRKKSSQ